MFEKKYLLIMTLFTSTMMFAQNFEEEISPETLQINAEYAEKEKIHTLTNGQDFEINSCDHPLLALNKNSALEQAFKEGRIEDALLIVQLGISLGCKEYIDAFIAAKQLLKTEQSE